MSLCRKRQFASDSCKHFAKVCATEVAQPDAFRQHRGAHFEGRLEILCLAAARQDPGSEISRALARLQIPRPAAAFSRKISPDRI